MHSAMSVAKIIATKGGANGGLNLFSLASKRSKRPAPERPTSPAKYWKYTAKMPLSHTTHSREKPKCEPAAMLDPQFPGSIYATLTTVADPQDAQRKADSHIIFP